MQKFKTPQELLDFMSKNGLNYLSKNENSRNKIINASKESVAAFFYQQIINGIESWYSSYESNAYHDRRMNWNGRTRDWSKSLNKDPIVTENSGCIRIQFNWGPTAWHTSVFKNGQSGFVPLLFEDGWAIKNGKGYNSPPRRMFDFSDFGSGNGLHIVENAAKATKKKYGDHIVIKWGDRTY